MHTVKWFQVLPCITNNSFKYESYVYTQLNVKTVLFQTLQIIMSPFFILNLNTKQFYLTHRIISGATIPDQSGPGSDGYEGILRFSQSSSITGASPSNCLMSYLEYSWSRGCTPLQRCSWRILQPQPSGLHN